MPDGSLRAAVVSYTAFSPLPDRSGGLFSAALSFPRIAPRHPSLFMEGLPALRSPDFPPRFHEATAAASLNYAIYTTSGTCPIGE